MVNMTTQSILDTDLKEAVVAELSWLPYLNDTKIGVAVNDGAVMLSGEVDSYPEKLQAEHAAMRVRGVTAIAEELTVRGKWQGAGDLDIAREATEALDRAVNLPDGAVTATVHDHAITLSGQVLWQYQRESAARAVRYLKGITAVHNLISVKPVASAAGIRTAISAALVRSAEFDGRNITVHATHDGSVRLEGAVRSQHEREAAQRAAWFAPGVTAVVNDLHVRS
jgi:osmotically-inducible protein OsmY